MTTAVLALQGAFAEHRHMLEALGEATLELRQAGDLARDFDRLVLPGGESTVQGKLLREQAMLAPLRERIEEGMPVLGTCAGLILLASRIEDGGGEAGSSTVDVSSTAGDAGGRTPAQGWASSQAGPAGRDAGGRAPAGADHTTQAAAGAGSQPPLHLATLPVTVRRNAYGRQLASFHATAPFAGLDAVPMTFIRAPQITGVGEGVEILAEVDGVVVSVRHGNQIATAFHPELDEDTRIHEMFLGLG